MSDWRLCLDSASSFSPNGLAFGGQVVISGGMSAERFELHNFDVLLGGVAIRANVYRYFFSPPRDGDAAVLREISGMFGHPDFHVPIGGIHGLEDFKRGVVDGWNQPGSGKRMFAM